MKTTFAAGSGSAVADLVNGLNAVAGAGTYAYVDPGTNVGIDEIAVAFVYKPAEVSPAGPLAILDSTVDPTFIDTKNRPVLIQTFDQIAGGRLNITLAHLKSKGSPCADVGDPNAGDGQGNCNGTRTSAATAPANYLATDPTGSGDPDFLLIGDFNAYALEDPITALSGVGYVDLLDLFQPPSVYTFVFDGQTGYLDYGLANGPLLSQVSGAAPWSINADEPDAFDYNEDFDHPSNLPLWYVPSAYRSSDPDPVLIGLNLTGPPPPPTPTPTDTPVPPTPTDTPVPPTPTATSTPPACITYVSSDVPKAISPIGSPSVSSTISVPTGGTITDVNILDLFGTHTYINDLDVNLISPAGTEVQVMRRSCASQDNFDLNLDDAAGGTWPCPPVGGGTYRPTQMLAAFNGQNKAGTWTLRIDDNANLDGGSLDGWSLEICTGGS